MKKLPLTIPLVLSLFLFVSPVFAAAPDGLGPWADTVFSSHQGLMKNGLPVPAVRSDPTSALGVAENDTVDGHFFSLGFGGNIALGFDNGISNGAMVVEATNTGYPSETAKVEMSEDGVHWVMAGNVTQDGTVNKPRQLTCAKYVRITDTSNPANFSDATADGYDVDGVKATGDPCPIPTPTITGGRNCSNTNIVTQKNTSYVSTTVNTSSSTGNNVSGGNTGGGSFVNTGNVGTSVHILTVTDTNSATLGNTCKGSTNASIIGTGPGSTNTININN